MSSLKQRYYQIKKFTLNILNIPILGELFGFALGIRLMSFKITRLILQLPEYFSWGDQLTRIYDSDSQFETFMLLTCLTSIAGVIITSLFDFGQIFYFLTLAFNLPISLQFSLQLVFEITRSVFSLCFPNKMVGGQEIIEQSTVKKIIPFADGSELDIQKVLQDFHMACEKSGSLPIHLYILPDLMEVNAFAAGSSFYKKNYTIAMSIGLINNVIKINQDNPEAAYRQINAVLCHEIGHLINNHLLQKILIDNFLKLSSYALSINMPMFTTQILLTRQWLNNKFSRIREIQADVHAIKLVSGEDMIDALSIIRGEKMTPSTISKNAHHNYSQWFNLIRPAVMELKDIFEALFEWKATHPSMLNRYENIRRKQQIIIDSPQPKREILASRML